MVSKTKKRNGESKRKNGCDEETKVAATTSEEDSEEKKRQQQLLSVFPNESKASFPGTKSLLNLPLALLKDTRALHTRLRCFEREAVHRSASKVLASRAAAVHLHSPEVLLDHWGVEGVSNVDSTFLVQLLREKGLNADMGEALDAALFEAVKPFLDFETS